MTVTPVTDAVKLAPVKKSDFDYVLPTELIAQAPLSERTASRLLVVPQTGEFVDSQFSQLGEWLRPGDLLVFNDTRVIPARLFGQKASGGRVEILLERLLGDNAARVQIRSSKSPKPGTQIVLDGGGTATVTGRDEAFFLLDFAVEGDLESYLDRVGKLPLPPYIERDVSPDDAIRYQTVFAKNTGAVAAPTAGLHFSDALLEQLRANGIEFGYVTLHVGAGTFQPVRVDDLSEHVMHKERIDVSAELAEKIHAARARGGRVIGVGTTVVRALETATQQNPLKQVAAFTGESQIFILPGYRITSVDAMITNFHLPESTLLMMVSAFSGFERIMAAYRHAIAQKYRFFSYGDAMLLFPAAHNGERA